MNKFKRILAISLACAMLVTASFGSTVNTAYANDTIDQSENGQYEVLTAVSSGGAILATQEEMEMAENDVKASASSITRSVTWQELTTRSHLTYYYQDLQLSSGPACIKMALKFLKGEEYDESVIRLGCDYQSASGASLANMATYINQEQSENVYVLRYNQIKTIMKSNLYYGIVEYNSPPIIGVNQSTSAGWNYNINGQYVMVYSAASDQSAFKIMDPWAGYVGDHNNYYLEISADDLFEAYYIDGETSYGYMY